MDERKLNRTPLARSAILKFESYQAVYFHGIDSLVLERMALRAATWVARRVGHYCHAVIPGRGRAGEHGITDFGLALSLKRAN